MASGKGTGQAGDGLERREGCSASFTGVLKASVPVQEKEYAVSPVTPLLSTAIEENAWVCGA